MMLYRKAPVRKALLVCAALLMSAPALQAAPSTPAMTLPTIAWPQDTITADQVLTLLSSTMGSHGVNIQFPNRSNWNVDPGQMQSLLSNYNSSAKTMGLNPKNVPPLGFSTSGIKGTVPVSGAMKFGDMSQSSMDILKNVQKQHLELSWLPTWMQGLVDWVYSILMAVAEFFGNAIRSSFR